jgi:HAAS domain-containing protein
MTGADDYLAAVRSSMFGMDSKVRDDILKELRSHLTEALAANGGDAGRAIASLESPASVGREYRRVYGFGNGFKLLFVAAAALLALVSAPFLSVGPDGAVPNGFALVGLVALVAWLLGVSVLAGSRVGLYAGVAALAVRTAVALALAASYPGPTIEFAGGISLALANVLLVILGWLPGTAKKAWSKPTADL